MKVAVECVTIDPEARKKKYFKKLKNKTNTLYLDVKCFKAIT